MTDKFEALSQPVAWDVEYATASSIDGECVYTLRTSRPLNPGESLYSQEYVTALLAENERQKAIVTEYQELIYHMDGGGDFFEFQRGKCHE